MVNYSIIVSFFGLKLHLYIIYWNGGKSEVEGNAESNLFMTLFVCIFIKIHNLSPTLRSALELHRSYI